MRSDRALGMLFLLSMVMIVASVIVVLISLLTGVDALGRLSMQILTAAFFPLVMALIIFMVKLFRKNDD